MSASDPRYFLDLVTIPTYPIDASDEIFAQWARPTFSSIVGAEAVLPTIQILRGRAQLGTIRLLASMPWDVGTS